MALEQTAVIPLYNINKGIFVMEKSFVFFELRKEPLNIIYMSFCFEGSISFLRTGFKEKQLF
jgi:hypothetical protein